MIRIARISMLLIYLIFFGPFVCAASADKAADFTDYRSAKLKIQSSLARLHTEKTAILALLAGVSAATDWLRVIEELNRDSSAYFQYVNRSPGVCGVVEGKILVNPEQILNLADDELDEILLHESFHLTARHQQMHGMQSKLLFQLPNVYASLPNLSEEQRSLVKKFFALRVVPEVEAYQLNLLRYRQIYADKAQDFLKTKATGSKNQQNRDVARILSSVIGDDRIMHRRQIAQAIIMEPFVYQPARLLEAVYTLETGKIADGGADYRSWLVKLVEPML